MAAKKLTTKRKAKTASNAKKSPSKIRRVPRSHGRTAIKRKTAKKTTTDYKKTLLDTSSKLLESIRTKDTKAIEKELNKAMSHIENSALVRKVERMLHKFQTTMIKEGDKLVKNVKKSVSTSKKTSKK